MIEFIALSSESNAGYSQLARFHTPYAMAWIGGSLVVIFSFLFVRILQLKIQGWNQKKISPLPLEGLYSISSWVGALAGLTIMFTGVLQVFNFSLFNSLVASLILALTTGIPMWGVVKQLLLEVKLGTIKEIDQFF